MTVEADNKDGGYWYLLEARLEYLNNGTMLKCGCVAIDVHIRDNDLEC